MKKFLFILVLPIFGCATTSQSNVKTEVIAPPKYLTAKVDVEKPPVTEEYLSMSVMEREDVLVKKFRQQMLNVETCNEQLNSIDLWKIDQFKLYGQSRP